MVDWVVSCRVNEFCYAECLTRKGTGLWWLRGLVALLFAFEASSCPYAACLSDVEGGGLLADGSGLMQLTTWGSAASVCFAF